MLVSSDGGEDQFDAFVSIRGDFQKVGVVSLNIRPHVMVLKLSDHHHGVQRGEIMLNATPIYVNQHVACNTNQRTGLLVGSSRFGNGTISKVAESEAHVLLFHA